MTAIDAFWHVASFFAPPLAMGGVAAALTRLIWRRELAGASTWRLWLWTSGAAASASLAGLLAFAHDGMMATYAAMVCAGAVALWWSGFRSRHR